MDGCRCLVSIIDRIVAKMILMYYNVSGSLCVVINSKVVFSVTHGQSNFCD